MWVIAGRFSFMAILTFSNASNKFVNPPFDFASSTPNIWSLYIPNKHKVFLMGFGWVCEEEHICPLWFPLDFVVSNLFFVWCRNNISANWNNNNNKIYLACINNEKYIIKNIWKKIQNQETKSIVLQSGASKA